MLVLCASIATSEDSIAYYNYTTTRYEISHASSVATYIFENLRVISLTAINVLLADSILFI
jgi:hypothetical protein